MIPVARFAAVYFALVFTAGFVLGLIRVLWAVPRFGATASELLEAPLMLSAIFVSARFTVRRFTGALPVSGLLLAGSLALAVLLLVEFTVVLALRGSTIPEYVAGRDPLTGTVYLVLLGVFAVMPGLVAMTRPGGAPGPTQ